MVLQNIIFIFLCHYSNTVEVNWKSAASRIKHNIVFNHRCDPTYLTGNKNVFEEWVTKNQNSKPYRTIR